MEKVGDYYDILGIPRGSSVDDIKKAYRGLARKRHPDVDKSAGAEERFKKINEAYKILSDPQKKQAYDQFGSAAFSQTGGFGQGFGGFGGGFSPGGQTRTYRQGPFTYTYTTSAGDSGQGDTNVDFEEMFGGAGSIFDMFFGGGFRRKGQDVRLALTIDFVDGIKGLEQDINVKGKKIKIKVPPGVRNGTQLRFAGEGEGAPTGPKGEKFPPGDLFLHIQIKPNPKFERHGDDILLQTEISFSQAALGTVLEVPVIDPSSKTGEGVVKLKIPQGTQSNTDFRLKGKGMPKLRRWGRGDAYVKVFVKIPDKLSREQKRLIEELDDLI